MSTPKLRFKEFDRDWAKYKIAEVTEYLVDGTHFSPKSTEGEFKYVTSKNIRNDGLDLSNISYISKEEHEAIYKRCKVKFGDILLTKDGANTGNCCLNTLDEEFSLLSSVAVIRGKKGNFDNKFLMQIFQSDLGQNTIISSMSGQAITRITLTKLKDYSFNFPEFEEQTKIASFLSAVDEKISQLNQKHALLSQYKQGMMQKLFSQQIRFKADDGSEFGEWEKKELKTISQIYDGTHQTPNYVEEGVPFYSVEHVTANNFTKTKFIAEDVYLAELKRVKLEKGDILLTRIGDIGTSRLIDWEVRASFYVSLALIKVKEKHSSSFVNQYIKSPFFQRELHERTIHVAFPKKINLGEIGLCVIKVPCLKEQIKIANFLSAIDQKIEVVAQQIEQAKTWKKGLLQQMFV
ncbi:restriction endonuclease subunit S [Acinetobacter bereziniae]|uniref:restriction endonuclease subunit S n=1 Tax=Acinetobacter bereziniae TaxID=106648 RepID=UPI0039C42B1F